MPQVQKLLPSSKHGSLYAIDLETIGTDASNPNCGVVGIGFANEDGCFYIDLRGMEVAAYNYLIEFLCNIKLTAFNVLFDGAFLASLTGRWLDWVGCSYALYKQLSSEGFDGQEWTLESAQLGVLGWPDSNKDEINRVLKERGLTKAEMSTLEPEILAPYCAHDAEAAWQLWHHLNAVIDEKDFKFLREYHQREFMTEVRLLCEAQFRGVSVNLPALKSYHTELIHRIDSALKSFLDHHLVAPHIRAYDMAVSAAIEAAAPARLTQKGEVSVRWQKWSDSKEARIEANRFNPNSSQQLAWLFYEKIYKVLRETAQVVVLEIDGKQQEVEKTGAGKRSVKQQLLPLFGEPGALLRAYNKLRKEETYVSAAIAIATERNGRIHPMFNSVGTTTLRLSGGNHGGD